MIANIHNVISIHMVYFLDYSHVTFTTIVMAILLATSTTAAKSEKKTKIMYIKYWYFDRL